MDTKQAEIELSTIKKIMEDSRRVAVDNGKHYIFWGLLVSVALFINYFMVIYDVSLNYQGMMWFVLMLGGALTGAIMEKIDHRKRTVHTFAGKLLGTLWFASGISMFIFGFLGTVAGAYSAIYICPIIFTVLGVSYYVSAEIQQTSWFKFLSLGWWAGAAFLFIFPGMHTFLVAGVMLIAFQTLPGFILYRRWRKELNPSIIKSDNKQL